MNYPVSILDPWRARRPPQAIDDDIPPVFGSDESSIAANHCTIGRAAAQSLTLRCISRVLFLALLCPEKSNRVDGNDNPHHSGFWIRNDFPYSPPLASPFKAIMTSD